MKLKTNQKSTKINIYIIAQNFSNTYQNGKEICTFIVIFQWKSAEEILEWKKKKYG